MKSMSFIESKIDPRFNKTWIIEENETLNLGKVSWQWIDHCKAKYGVEAPSDLVVGFYG